MKTYIVHFSYALDYEDGHDTLGNFRKRSDAVACLKEKADELREEWNEDEIEVDTENRFCAYWDGFYDKNHHELWIEECELQ